MVDISFLSIRKPGKKENAVGYLTQDDKKIEVFPHKTKLKAGETCVGFLQVESNVHKDTFVRVVKRKKDSSFMLSYSACAVACGNRNMVSVEPPEGSESGSECHLLSCGGVWRTKILLISPSPVTLNTTFF